MQSVRTVRSSGTLLHQSCSFSNSSIFQFMHFSPSSEPTPHNTSDFCPSPHIWTPIKTLSHCLLLFLSHTAAGIMCSKHCSHHAISQLQFTGLPCQILVASVSVEALYSPPHLSSPTALSFPASLNSLPVSYILMFAQALSSLALCIHSPAHTIHFLFP